MESDPLAEPGTLCRGEARTWGHGSGVVSSVEAILRPSGRGVDWSNVRVVHLCIQYSGWQVKIVVLDHGRERREQNGKCSVKKVLQSRGGGGGGNSGAQLKKRVQCPALRQ